MKMSPLVNRPNISHREAGFEEENYTLHSWCLIETKKGWPMPLFVSVNNGPIQCRSCGRRVSKRLRKSLLNHCTEGRYSDFIDTQEDEVILTYYRLSRKDLHEEGLRGWQLLARLAVEVT